MDILKIGAVKEKRVSKTITLKREIWDEFQLIAKSKGNSASRMIEDFMQKYIAESKKTASVDSLELNNK